MVMKNSWNNTVDDVVGTHLIAGRSAQAKSVAFKLHLNVLCGSLLCFPQSLKYTQNQNQNSIYCQVGLHLPGICSGV